MLRWTLACLLAVVALPTLAASAADEPELRPGEHAGLPYFPPWEGYTWGAVKATANSSVAKAQQWIRLPAQSFVASVHPRVQDQQDRTCTVSPPYSTTRDYVADAYAVSPASAPHPYGHLGTAVVRTVAFGAIPVEVTVRLRQTRDQADLPKSFRIDAPTKTFCPGRGPHAGPGEEESHWPPATVVGEVQIDIDAVRVDGVPLQLEAGCRTTGPGTLRLRSIDYFSLDPDNGPEAGSPGSPYYSPTAGGPMTGTIDIPAFTGCRRGTEDLSPLLTGTVSGPANEVAARLTDIRNPCVPWINPNADLCRYPDDIELPQR